jgi:hypothetical protein
LTEAGSLSCKTHTVAPFLSAIRNSSSNYMKTASFPNTWRRNEGDCLADKDAASRIDRGRGGRDGAYHARDDLRDDCRRDGLCVGGFQKGLLETPYWVSPFERVVTCESQYLLPPSAT